MKDYDYSQAGVYFVTICTHSRTCFLGDIINGELQLITNYAINASSSVINEKDNLLTALEDLKSSIADSAQYEIIQSMLVRINSWLNLVIHDQSYDDQWI